MRTALPSVLTAFLGKIIISPRFDRHFQTHRTRLGRPFIAYQLSTRGPHIVISYVWAGVATTDQIRSDHWMHSCTLLCPVGFALSFHLDTRCCENLRVSVDSSASPLVSCSGFLPFSWPSFLVCWFCLIFFLHNQSINRALAAHSAVTRRYSHREPRAFSA